MGEKRGIEPARTEGGRFGKEEVRRRREEGAEGAGGRKEENGDEESIYCVERKVKDEAARAERRRNAMRVL